MTVRDDFAEASKQFTALVARTEPAIDTQAITKIIESGSAGTVLTVAVCAVRTLLLAAVSQFPDEDVTSDDFLAVLLDGFLAATDTP